MWETYWLLLILTLTYWLTFIFFKLQSCIWPSFLIFKIHPFNLKYTNIFACIIKWYPLLTLTLTYLLHFFKLGSSDLTHTYNLLSELKIGQHNDCTFGLTLTSQALCARNKVFTQISLTKTISCGMWPYEHIMPRLAELLFFSTTVSIWQFCLWEGWEEYLRNSKDCFPHIVYLSFRQKEEEEGAPSTSKNWSVATQVTYSRQCDRQLSLWCKVCPCYMYETFQKVRVFLWTVLHFEFIYPDLVKNLQWLAPILVDDKGSRSCIVINMHCVVQFILVN